MNRWSRTVPTDCTPLHPERCGRLSARSGSAYQLDCPSARGRLGCPSCYTVFQTALEPLLEKIHGGTRHVGKAPDESSAVDRSRERRLVALRRELQAVVREERYEEAAGLRDRLARFEQGEEEAPDELGGEPGEPDGSADADR